MIGITRHGLDGVHELRHSGLVWAIVRVAPHPYAAPGALLREEVIWQGEAYDGQLCHTSLPGQAPRPVRVGETAIPDAVLSLATAYLRGREEPNEN